MAYGGGDCSADVASHPLPLVPGRLAGSSAVAAGSQGTYAHPITAPARSGFRGKWGKEQLSPAQDVVFLELSLNSVTFTVRLSAKQVEGFRKYLTLPSGQNCLIQFVSSVTQADVI